MENWIESEGSPFIIMDKENAEKWTGLESDYELACNVSDYIGLIHLDNYNVIVLGDEPMPIKVIINENEIIIIRWMNAPDDNSVNEVIKHFDFSSLPTIEECDVNWNSNNLVIFDSVDTFNNTNSTIYFTIKNKHSFIKTFHYNTVDISLIIHQLK